MNIVREQREQGVSLIKIVVEESDYAAEVEKVLRDYKRKANVPGFRPGMVPMGVVKKMYGKGVLAEQSYQAASKGVFNYLKEEKIDYVGDVIPSEEQGDFDFDNGTEFEFIFEIGEAPAFDAATVVSKDDKLTYNLIKIEEQMHNDYRSNYLRKFGRLVDAESVEADEALTVTLDNGDMQIEDAYVGLISMSEEERAPFIGKVKGDKMQVNVNELYKTESQRAAILGVKEDELAEVNPEFELEITNIRKFADPEMNEEFFKMAFPAGDVTSEEQLDEYVDKQIAVELARESDNLFGAQLSKYVREKANLQLPEAFLKRWLVVINEGRFSMEEIERDFADFVKMYSWNFIQKRVIEAEEIIVTPEDAMAEAKAVAQAQLAQYGMGVAPDDMLENYGKQILSTKEQGQKIYESLFERRVINSLKDKVTVEEKTISLEDFGKELESLKL
ncbi:MAG: trigger factor [Rikenellaceae bacterium]